jgi:hypothetical protein
MVVLLFAALSAAAQQQTEYNRKGDEAMDNLDFGNAKIWYEEGLSNCDPYSINQLTSIWLVDESMRAIMRNVMSRCLTCLTNRAIELKDTASMNKLVLYYSEGIGTQRNTAKIDFWKDQLKLAHDVYDVYDATPTGARVKKTKMNFFLGYSASYHAPCGLTAGGIGRTVGWYLRFRSNLSFQNYTAEYDESKNELVDGAYPDLTGKTKVNSWIATGGIIVKASPSFYISAGAGYCSRVRLCEIVPTGIVVSDRQDAIWAQYMDKYSFNGVAVDLDAAFRMGKVLYGSLGCSILNLEFASANAGIGVFF